MQSHESEQPFMTIYKDIESWILVQKSVLINGQFQELNTLK